MPKIVDGNVEATQDDRAKSDVGRYLTDLRGLDPQDAAFAVWGRFRAIQEGLTPAEAKAQIYNRATAQAYWLALPTVEAMTAKQRQHFGRDIQATVNLLALMLSLI